MSNSCVLAPAIVNRGAGSLYLPHPLAVLVLFRPHDPGALLPVLWDKAYSEVCEVTGHDHSERHLAVLGDAKVPVEEVDKGRSQ